MQIRAEAILSLPLIESFSFCSSYLPKNKEKVEDLTHLFIIHVCSAIILITDIFISLITQ